jgi:hypothetical protein
MVSPPIIQSRKARCLPTRIEISHLGYSISGGYIWPIANASARAQGSTGSGESLGAFNLNPEVWGIVLVLLLVLILDLLAIRAEKRARSFHNSSVPASVAAERLFSRLRARAQARFLISGFGFKHRRRQRETTGTTARKIFDKQAGWPADK